MRADLEGMQETPARPPLPLPPRPDLGGMLPPGPDHVLGTDFYVPEPRRSSRMVRILAIITLTCVAASVALPPLVHAWESGQRSHEFTFMATIRRCAGPLEPVRADPLRREPGHGAPGVPAGRAGRRAPALERHRDRVHVRRADGRGPDAVPRRVPTRPVRRPLGAGPHRLGRSADQHLRFRSRRSRGSRRRRASVSRSGAADDLRERRRRDQRRRSQPAGVRVPGGAGPGRDARARPRPGPGSHQGPGRADGAIGWGGHRLRSRRPRRAQRAGTIGGLPHDPVPAVSLPSAPHRR